MYTFTVRWEDLKRTEVKGRVEHAFRDVVAEKEGRFRDHMNTGIDTGRMNQNKSFVVGEDGEWKKLEDIQEIYDRMESVIGQAKRSTYVDRKGVKREREFRSDTSVMVEHILQLDPKFYDQWRDPETGAVVMPENEDEREKIWHSIDSMMNAWCGQVGEENCVGFALHLDEKNPHLQLFSVPLTKARELSYRKTYGAGGRKASQKKFADIHDGYRDFMRSQGYEIMHERVSRGRTHLHPDDYKKWRDQAEAVEAGAKELEKGRDRLVEISRAQEEEAYKLQAQRQEAKAQKAEAQKKLAEAEEQARGIVQKARESMAEELERLKKLEEDLEAQAQKQAQERLEIDQMKSYAQEDQEAAQEALKSAQEDREKVRRLKEALRYERAEVKHQQGLADEVRNRLDKLWGATVRKTKEVVAGVEDKAQREKVEEVAKTSLQRAWEELGGTSEKTPWQDGPDFG